MKRTVFFVLLVAALVLAACGPAEAKVPEACNAALGCAVISKDQTVKIGEMQWVARIHRALEENRLRLLWQEIRLTVPGSSDHHVRHVELLLRMVDDDGSEIMPMAFIPAAERYYHAVVG